MSPRHPASPSSPGQPRANALGAGLAGNPMTAHQALLSANVASGERYPNAPRVRTAHSRASRLRHFLSRLLLAISARMRLGALPLSIIGLGSWMLALKYPAEPGWGWIKSSSLSP